MADVYRIGVAIAMTSNSAQVLGVLGRDLMDLGRQAKVLESYLADVRTAAISAMTAINGTFALRSFADAVKHGGDVLQQQDRMKSAGMSQAEVARATAEAWRETYRVVHRGVTENLAMIQRLREVVGELGPALKLAPTASRFQTALVSITGRSANGPGRDVFRFLQLGGSFTSRASGQIDIGEAKRWARIGEAIVAGTHGHGTHVTPRDPKRIQLQVGAAGSGPDHISRMELAHLIGQMKEGGSLMGSRVGAPLYNLIEQLETPSSRQSIAVLERMKPIDSSKVHVHRGGKITSESGVLKQPSLLETRTSEWVRSIVSPARQQLGAKTTQEQVSMTGQLALSSSAAQLIQESLRNPSASKMEYANTRTAFNVDPYDIAKNNPTARIASFTKASKDLLTALGAPMVDDVTSLLGKLTAGLNTVALFATKHPKIAADTEMVGAAIAGLSVVGGMLAIVSSAASALGPFAAGGAAASGLAFLGGTAVTSLSAAAGLFAPGAAGAAGLLGLAGGLTTLTAVLAGFAGSLCFMGAMKPTTLGTGERAQLDKLFPNRPRGIPVRPGTPLGIVRASPLQAPALAPPSGSAAPGAAIRKGSYNALPPDGSVAVHNIAAVYLDGHAVGQMIFRRAGDQATLPPASGTGYDPSMTPTFTANLIGNA